MYYLLGFSLHSSWKKYSTTSKKNSQAAETLFLLSSLPQHSAVTYSLPVETYPYYTFISSYCTTQTSPFQILYVSFFLNTLPGYSSSSLLFLLLWFLLQCDSFFFLSLLAFPRCDFFIVDSNLSRISLHQSIIHSATLCTYTFLLREILLINLSPVEFHKNPVAKYKWGYALTKNV